MKKIIFAFLMFAAISCTKNVTSKNELNASATSIVENSVALNGSTKFGSIILGNFTNDQRVAIAKKLNVKYVRGTITMDKWINKFTPYETYVKNGIQVVLNVCSALQTNTPVAFLRDLTNYRQKFNSITDKYKPEVIVVENEEINPNYHTGPLTDYINMLQAALDVCHSKGIKVTNGGIYGGQLETLAYRYLQRKGQNRADSFANNCMTYSQIKDAQTPNRNPSLEWKVRQLDTLLNFYINLDYINIHLYEPFNPNVDPSTVTSATPVVAADIQEYLIARTGKPVMTNETTPRDNVSPDLVTSVLKEYDRLNFPYAIWFNNDIGGSKPLYDLNTGALLNTGVAYSNFTGTY